MQESRAASSKSAADSSITAWRAVDGSRPGGGHGCRGVASAHSPISSSPRSSPASGGRGAVAGRSCRG
eukprot:6105303-Prymnesium_polylepis.1